MTPKIESGASRAARQLKASSSGSPPCGALTAVLSYFTVPDEGHDNNQYVIALASIVAARAGLLLLSAKFRTSHCCNVDTKGDPD